MKTALISFLLAYLLFDSGLPRNLEVVLVVFLGSVGFTSLAVSFMDSRRGR